MTKGLEQGMTKGLEQGMTKGREQGHLEIAKKLLAKGNSVEQVSELIGWPVEKVRRLKREEMH
jgi:predicted transposase/invertase (TIGR01784 family)